MREVKFRGKAVMDKEELDYQGIPNHEGWTFGSLIVDGNNYYIVGRIIEASDNGLIHEWWTEVLPESVGQYTGLKDKNDIEIYEGDVFKLKSLYICLNTGTQKIVEEFIPVTFEKGAYVLDEKGIKTHFLSGVLMGNDNDDSSDEWELKIAGNIHEHSHLLEGGEE